MNDEGEISWAEWQARKQAKRDEDERRLAAGEVTREQLCRENGVSAKTACAPLPWYELFKF